jgi:hypothetical protein
MQDGATSGTGERDSGSLSPSREKAVADPTCRSCEFAQYFREPDGVGYLLSEAGPEHADGPTSGIATQVGACISAERLDDVIVRDHQGLSEEIACVEAPRLVWQPRRYFHLTVNDLNIRPDLSFISGRHVTPLLVTEIS